MKKQKERFFTAQPQPQPQPPPPPHPHIAARFDLAYFRRWVPIVDHWEQHHIALQFFRNEARLIGNTSFHFNCANGHFVPKVAAKNGSSYTFDQCSAADKNWCWQHLVAQLDDESQQTVVQGSNRTHGGLVARKACESTRIDYTRRSAAERKTSTGKGTAVLYLWEFALLRDNGTVAFLRPTKGSTIVEYYEGLLTDYVRTDYDQVPT